LHRPASYMVRDTFLDNQITFIFTFTCHLCP
jgi:hypothetical protein